MTAKGKLSNAFHNILNTLQLPPRLRTSNELSDLMEVTKDSEFFKRIFRNLQTHDLHRICCMYMTLVECESGSSVYTIGENAENAYILLNGSVSLDLPKRLKISISVPKEFQIIVKNLRMNLANENLVENGEEKMIKHLFQDTLNWDARIVDDVHTCKHRDVAETVSVGESFGEVGLFTMRLRSLCAVANDKIYLAALSKQSLRKAIVDYTEKKLNDRIEFLYELSLFSAWSRGSILKFLELLSYSTYSYNQRIFKEGDPAQFAIFVMSGEVKITKAQFYNSTTPKVYKNQMSVNSPISSLRQGKVRELIKSNQMQLVVKGKNAIIGFDDLTNQTLLHTYSCYCYSSRAEVLIVSKQVFMERINRPENLNYIKTKTSLENLWITERVKEIKETDLKIARKPEENSKISENVDLKSQKRPEDEPKALKIYEFEQKKNENEFLQMGEEDRRPITDGGRIRSAISRMILRRNSMCEKREESPIVSRRNNERNSGRISSCGQSASKRPMTRLPPPNFLLSYRRKKYGEPVDPPFYTLL